MPQNDHQAPRRRLKGDFAPNPRAPFVELGVTSAFSFLRGASDATELVQTAHGLGYDAIGIADLNSLAGVVRLHAEARRAALRPIIGARIVLTCGTGFLAYPRDRAAYGRLSTLISKGRMRDLDGAWQAKGICDLTLDDLAEGFDLSQFGASPTKFDAEDLWPLTRERNQALPFDAVRDRIAALGVPADLAERFWAVASQNITKLDDLADWWTIFSQGAEPQIDPEDADFIAQAMPLLPPPPYTDATWGEWTAAVKEATGRKGKGLFMPLRKAVTGQAHGPDMAQVMPLLQVVKARG